MNFVLWLAASWPHQNGAQAPYAEPALHPGNHSITTTLLLTLAGDPP